MFLRQVKVNNAIGDCRKGEVQHLREPLALPEQAQAVAERIDAARGRALPGDMPLQAGESRGTDLAESVSYLALRVRGEVCGPKGRD